MKKILLILFLFSQVFAYSVINFSNLTEENKINKTKPKGYSYLFLDKEIAYDNFLKNTDKKSLLLEKEKLKDEIKQLLKKVRKEGFNNETRKKAIELALRLLYVNCLLKALNCRNGKEFFFLALKAEKAKTFKSLKFLFDLYLKYKKNC